MLRIFHELFAQAIQQWAARGTAALLAFIVSFNCALPATAQDAYRLNAGDRIALRIIAWDRIELDFIEYSALSGEYSVSSDGTVMVPMLGPVSAAGKNVVELADEMSLALQGRLGLVELPGTAISVVSYRPIYVLGAVQHSGFYEFSPGLTVQQAIALAGGIEPVLDEQSDGLSAAIRAAGTLREIGIDLARQKARAARLRAEMDGADTITPPARNDHPDGPTGLRAILDHEQNLFESRRDALQRKLDALEDSRTLLETEVAALQEKMEGQARQAALLGEQVGNIESLVERGLARSPNLLTLQSQYIDLQNRLLDTETAEYRARQSIAELERERIEIEADRRLEVLRELQSAEAEIERLTVRRGTTTQLLAGAEALLAGSDDEQAFRTVYVITREDSTGRHTKDAHPGTRLAPADVLEIIIRPAETDG